MILDGYIKNKNNMPVYNAIVDLKDEKFNSVYTTCSDENGYYKFDIPAGYYPFLIAVKGYKETGLEYWCQNIQLNHDMRLDVSIDTLEIYGLHGFLVKGAGTGLMVYFRPMALKKYLQGRQDIAPDNIDIKVSLENEECSVINVNKVKEYAADCKMTAYLVQVDTNGKKDWHKLDVEITDCNGNYGAATIFNY